MNARAAMSAASNKNDPRSRLPRLTRAEAEAFIASGAITGGMIPKVQESLAMLDAGLEAIHIVGLDPESALFDEGLEPGSRGTVFVR